MINFFVLYFFIFICGVIAAIVEKPNKDLNLMGAIGNQYALYIDGIYRNSFKTMDGCEGFKYIFYKDRENAKCVRFR